MKKVDFDWNRFDDFLADGIYGQQQQSVGQLHWKVPYKKYLA